jgi:hypothetical protein
MAKFDKEKDRALSRRAEMARMYHGTAPSGVTFVQGRKAVTGEVPGTIKRSKPPKSV